MNNILISPLFQTITGAVIALFGVHLSAWNQRKLAREAQQFQAQQKIDEWRRIQQKDEKDFEKKRLVEIYTNLHMIEREFSMTSLDIDWRKQSSQEYDQKYLEVCRKLDEIRAISALFFPELSENFNEVYGRMNIYWGYVKKLLEMEDCSYGDSKKRDHQEAIKASQDITIVTNKIKSAIQTMIEYRYRIN